MSISLIDEISCILGRISSLYCVVLEVLKEKRKKELKKKSRNYKAYYWRLLCLIFKAQKLVHLILSIQRDAPYSEVLKNQNWNIKIYQIKKFQAFYERKKAIQTCLTNSYPSLKQSLVSFNTSMAQLERRQAKPWWKVLIYAAMNDDYPSI